jgi:hypothetical protein
MFKYQIFILKVEKILCESCINILESCDSPFSLLL